VTVKLFFNGVNAASGRYGLAPMTAEDLAHHVLEDWAEAWQQRRHLRGDLERKVTNDRKILAIVKFLTTDVVRLLSENDTVAADWYVDAARRMLAILFDDGAAVGAGDALLLAERLRDDPVQAVTWVVKLLSTGQGAALAEWLLGHGAEGRTVLRSTLEARFDQALVSLQRAYVDERTIPFYDDHGLLSTAWIGGFVQELEQLPVESLRVVLDTDIVAAAHRRLTCDLNRLPELCEGDANFQPELRTPLLALFSAEGSRSWRGLVERLGGLLLAVREAEIALPDERLRRALREWLDELRRRVSGHLGLVPWIDPCSLAQTGWGIVFPARLPKARREEVEQAMAPLLNWRRAQAGDLFFIFAEDEGYRLGETAGEFLGRSSRRATVVNPADPVSTGVPYYLLLVGSPEEIPFEFQYQLDVQYAVGRLDFGDDIGAYGAYARNVVAAEHPSFTHSSQVVFFRTEHKGDEATSLSANHLVQPLVRHLKDRAQHTGCRVHPVDPAKATKRNLVKLLQLDPPPALLFTATHGLEFDSGHPDQRRRQGALLCQDWEGGPGEVAPDCYLAAEDVTDALNLRGMVLFLFACYGAGTPRYDEYHRGAFRATAQAIAEVPFVAELPRAMLALRDRGALAVVGHVDRAWGLSFMTELGHRPEAATTRRQENVEVFAATLHRLLEGHPVGAALDFFNMRYAAVATELAYLYERITDPPSPADAYRLAELWTANNDARGYVVLGDPAVRIRMARPEPEMSS
jgi:hypothetical protein